MVDIKLSNFIIVFLLFSSHIWYQKQVFLLIVPFHANRVSGWEIQDEKDRILHDGQETQGSVYPKGTPYLKSLFTAILVHCFKAPYIQNVLRADRDILLLLPHLSNMKYLLPMH